MNFLDAVSNVSIDDAKRQAGLLTDLSTLKFNNAWNKLAGQYGENNRNTSDVLRSLGIRGWVGEHPQETAGAGLAAWYGAGLLGAGGAGGVGGSAAGAGGGAAAGGAGGASAVAPGFAGASGAAGSGAGMTAGITPGATNAGAAANGWTVYGQQPGLLSQTAGYAKTASPILSAGASGATIGKAFMPQKQQAPQVSMPARQGDVLGQMYQQNQQNYMTPLQNAQMARMQRRNM